MKPRHSSFRCPAIVLTLCAMVLSCQSPSKSDEAARPAEDLLLPQNATATPSDGGSNFPPALPEGGDLDEGGMGGSTPDRNSQPPPKLILIGHDIGDACSIPARNADGNDFGSCSAPFACVPAAKNGVPGYSCTRLCRTNADCSGSPLLTGDCLPGKRGNHALPPRCRLKK
jgi:hypothetical protein